MATTKTTRHTALAMPSDRVARCRSAPSWSCFCNWTAARWRRRPSSARRTLCALATTFSPLCSLLDRQRRRQRPPVMCSRHLRSRDCRRPSNGRKNGLASNRALDSLLTGFFRCRTHKAWRLERLAKELSKSLTKMHTETGPRIATNIKNILAKAAKVFKVKNDCIRRLRIYQLAF